MPYTKSRNIDRARDLYERGHGHADIARKLGRSLSTIRRWAREDAGNGRPWLRKPANRFEERLSRVLEQRLDALVNDAQTEPREKDGDRTREEAVMRLEDRALKLCKLLRFIRDASTDPTPILDALRQLVLFAKGTLDAEELRAVRKAVRLFVDTLREDYE